MDQDIGFYKISIRETVYWSLDGLSSNIFHILEKCQSAVAYIVVKTTCAFSELVSPFISARQSIL